MIDTISCWISHNTLFFLSGVGFLSFHDVVCMWAAAVVAVAFFVAFRRSKFFTSDTVFFTSCRRDLISMYICDVSRCQMSDTRNIYSYIIHILRDKIIFCSIRGRTPCVYCVLRLENLEKFSTLPLRFSTLPLLISTLPLLISTLPLFFSGRFSAFVVGVLGYDDG